jgi:hypothetical protein
MQKRKLLSAIAITAALQALFMTGCGGVAGPCVVDPLQVTFEAALPQSYRVALSGADDATAHVLCERDDQGAFTLQVLEEADVGEGSIACADDGFTFEPVADGEHHVVVESVDDEQVAEATFTSEFDGGCPANYGEQVVLEWES